MQSVPNFIRQSTAIESIREAILAEVHFGTVGPAPGEPTVLRIEGPGALTGVAERALLGHERALRRAGFRSVECLGVDPTDPRGRPGRHRALIPDIDDRWEWERTSGAELQARIIDGRELRPSPRALPDETPANVIPMRVRRRR